jgi:hypothetical protein
MTDNDKSALATAEVENLTEDERGEWLKSGELPTEKPVDVTPPAKEAEKEKVADEPEPVASNFRAAKPEAAKPNQMGYKALRDRVKELEAKLEGKEPPIRSEEAPVERVAEPAKPADEKIRLKPTMEDKDEKGAPKYKTIEDFFEDLADWKAETKIAAFQKAEAEKATKQSAEARQQKTVQAWQGQVDAARKVHADFDKLALDPNLRIPAGSAVEQWVLKSDIGTEILYALAQDPERLEAIHAMHPVDAARELVLMEAELTADDKPLPTAPPAQKRISSAPPPAREVGSRQAVDHDPVGEALAENDFDAYREAANLKEMKAKRRN